MRAQSGSSGGFLLSSGWPGDDVCRGCGGCLSGITRGVTGLSNVVVEAYNTPSSVELHHCKTGLRGRTSPHFPLAVSRATVFLPSHFCSDHRRNCRDVNSRGGGNRVGGEAPLK